MLSSYLKFGRTVVSPRSFNLVPQPVTCLNLVHRRFGTDDDSHDDFKPKRKTVPGDSVQEMIQNQVNENPIMLYMKGTPSAPSCGFSYQVVQILHTSGVKFASVNVLEHDQIREGIKQYSDWPTIPQLYVNGEFVGGCDIVTQMFQSGDLETLFKENKLIK
mmetsp:Transcript_30406/g.40143  ORF Transcript_30406/g.40143 Transcript_30406/m.40143 type:complete len:161 (+) Transcript_30406:93-575(+)